MTRPAPHDDPLVVNGWSIYAHPLFLDQVEGLIEEVEARKARDPENYRKKNCTKRLAAIFKLVTEDIPADPAGAQFRQAIRSAATGSTGSGQSSSSSTGCSSVSTAQAGLSCSPG